MQQQITARHFEADPNIRAYAAERINRLERFYNGITDAQVILRDDQTLPSGKLAEVTLNVHRQRLTARVSASTYEEAIDRCVERLRRQVLKYKKKRRNIHQDYHR